MRVQCKSSGSTGTAFVHKSGRVITAAHVVDGCPVADLGLFIKDSRLAVADVVADSWLDIALLTPKGSLGSGLPVGSGEGLQLGDTVVSWGFPMGYFGLDPMVTVGYLAAVAPVPAKPKPVLRTFVNGAFNLGNSGGPVIDVQSLTVVGIVNAKMTPIPSDVAAAMTAMQNQSSGFVYTARTSDGRTVTLSEAQVVARVLEHLQSQTQLVVGTAVILGDVREFLKKHGVEP
jgi:S1-C subfamily serine protease